MKLRLIGVVIWAGLIAGCVSQYGPKGVNGGYSDKRLNATSYFVKYDGPILGGDFIPIDKFLPLWKRRASELCGSDDYYSDYKELRLDPTGHEAGLGRPTIMGYVYCNGNFVDTRKQEPEDNYRQFIQIPVEKLVYQADDPLWDLLVSGKYSELQDKLAELDAARKKGTVSDRQYDLALATFGKVNGVSEQYLSGWLTAYPDSAEAHYAMAEYELSFGWFKRGNATWDKVPQDGREAFSKYTKLAAVEVDNALKLAPDFCPAHVLKVDITRGAGDGGLSNSAAFAEAEKHCPGNAGIYATRLSALQPRWGGSMDKMRQLIDTVSAKYPKLKSLQAYYLTEEGDQLLFKQQYEEALNKYNQAVSLGDFALVYHERAVALESLGRFVEASTSYKNAIALSPFDHSAYEGLVKTLLKQNDFFGALMASSMLTQINNLEPDYFTIQGDLFYRVRRYQDALVDYKKAAILAPDDAFLKHKVRMAQFQIDVRATDDKQKSGTTSI